MCHRLLTHGSSTLVKKKLMVGDEVVFYFRFEEHAWKLLIRKEIEWEEEDLQLKDWLLFYEQNFIVFLFIFNLNTLGYWKIFCILFLFWMLMVKFNYFIYYLLYYFKYSLFILWCKVCRVGTQHAFSLCHKLFSFLEWTNKVTLALTYCNGAQWLGSDVQWSFSCLLCSSNSCLGHQWHPPSVKKVCVFGPFVFFLSFLVLFFSLGFSILWFTPNPCHISLSLVII